MENYKIPILTPSPIRFQVIDSALTVLKSSNADGQFYRQKSWCIVRDYLFAAMNLDDNKQVLFALLTHEDFKTKAHLTGQFPSQGTITKYACIVRVNIKTGR